MNGAYPSNPHARHDPLAVDDTSPFVVQPLKHSLTHKASFATESAGDSRGSGSNPFLVSRPTSPGESTASTLAHKGHHTGRVSDQERHRHASQEHNSLSDQDAYSAHSGIDGDRQEMKPQPPSASSRSTADEKRVASRPSDPLRELNSKVKATRIELKAWESNFQEQHGRPPTQADIAKDDDMVKKYRAYGKLKKAIAAAAASGSSAPSASSSTAHHTRSSSSTAAPSSSSTRSVTRESELTRTPKKAHHTFNPFLIDVEASSSSGSTRLRTPTKKTAGQVEYISPKIIGLMSPRRSRRTQDDPLFSPSSSSSSHLVRPTARDSVVSSLTATPTKTTSASITSPSFGASPTARLLFSPAKSSNLRPYRTPNGHSLDSIHEVQEDETNYTAPRTPSRRHRTPNSRSTPGAGDSYANPFLSPSGRPAAKSPLFGGMNKSKKRTRMARTASEHSITASQTRDQHTLAAPSQPTSEASLQGDMMRELPDSLEFSPQLGASNPLLLTPRRSTASKASRALFRHTSSSDLRASQRGMMSPSRKPVASRHPSFKTSTAPPLHLADFLFDSAAEAMDSMSIHDDAEEEVLERRRFIHGSRAASPAEHRELGQDDKDEPWVDDIQADDPSQYSPEISSPVARDFLGSNASQGIQHSPSWRVRSTSDSLAVDHSMDYGTEGAWMSASSSSPRDSDQLPSLTFSQPTQLSPLSPGSDNEFLFVAPGIHAHHQHRRRRPFGRSTFPISFSQTEDNKDDDGFEPAFVSQETGAKEAATAAAAAVDPLAATKMAVRAMAHSFQREDHLDVSGDDSDEDEEDSLWKKAEQGANSNARIKKKTQKRTTKLHKIVVSSSKTTATTARTTKRNDKAKAKDETKHTDEATTANDVNNATEQSKDSAADSEKKSSASTVATATKESSRQDPVIAGWANSNKPLVKSDRTYRGVGRAGARRTTTGSSSSFPDGNYVAYNLQRKSGRSARGGFRGRSRGSGGSLYGSGQTAATAGRFDTTSWRSEFDQDSTFSTGVMTNLTSHQQSMLLDEQIGDLDDLVEPDQEVLPWYGKVPDDGEAGDGLEDGVEDPLVASISPRYLPEDGPSSMKVNLGHILRRVWGYSSFRDGQLESIKRVLNNESTLLVLPTEQTDAQYKDFMSKLMDNTIKILFISPEKLTSASFQSLVASNSIPKISFLCVDEVHCLSEWSHNFRPAYLMLNHVLETQLGSPCVLGLTGTATEATKDSICGALGIDRETGVLSGPVIRKNLVMSVSVEEHREEALLNMLRSPRFMHMDAILIYVMKQSQADHLAAFLRVRNFNAESYHAGKSSQDRQRIQERFMHGGASGGVAVGAAAAVAGSGTGTVVGGADGTIGDGSQDLLSTTATSAAAGGIPPSTTTGLPSQRGIRILCATIAFGMGLNKSNIRSVIHFCMPKSLENYIQEIGRSGRDGRQSFCHMFLTQEDYLLHRSLAYADGMDFETLRWLLFGLFACTVPVGEEEDKGVKKRTIQYSRMPQDRDGGYSDEMSGEDDDGAPPSKKMRQNNGLSSRVAGGGSSRQHMTNAQESRRATLLPKSVVPVAPPEERLSIDPRENMYRTMMPAQSRRNLQRKRWMIIKEEQAELDFDIKKEVLATLLSYLELDPSKSIRCHGTIQSKCIFKIVQSEDKLVDIDRKSPLLDWIIRNGVRTTYRPSSSYSRSGGRSKSSGGRLSTGYACDTMHICQTFDISHHELYQELQKLRRQRWIVFEMSEPGWLLEMLQDPVQIMQQQQQQRQQPRQPRRVDRDASDLEEDDDNDDEDEASKEPVLNAVTRQQLLTGFLDQLSDRLYQKICAVERAGVAKVDAVYGLFHSVATPTWQMHPALEPRPVYKKSVALVSDSTGAAAGEAERELTEPEQVLVEGIQEYFAKTHGEGIGDVFEDMKKEAAKDVGSGGGSLSMDLDNTTTVVTSTVVLTAEHRMAMAQRMGKSMAMYTYQPPMIQELQRNWKAGLEVDLRVFLSIQFQQLGDEWLKWQAEVRATIPGVAGTSAGGVVAEFAAQPPAELRVIESPRVVSRIFHGMSSPCYPAMVWTRPGGGKSGSGGTSQYWAKYSHFDFATLLQMANRVLKELKVKYKVQAQSQSQRRLR
ncbi:hypothetical protein BGZ73_002378 [Actinomortierella ambigua]|nr:hypothetical protein BGZ73_002378 [Actinomortierella ambigua]